MSFTCFLSVLFCAALHAPWSCRSLARAEGAQCPDGECSAIERQGTPNQTSSVSMDRFKQLPGFTRSRVVPNSYAILSSESRVYDKLPLGWSGDVTFAAVVSPALGAHFTMYLVNTPAAASLPNPVTYGSVADNLERFLFVVSGSITVTKTVRKKSKKPKKTELTLAAGGYVYIAPEDTTLSVTTTNGASLVQIDRDYRGTGDLQSVYGHVDDVPVEIPDGEVFKLQRLLNASDPLFDFNIHVMQFEPGEYLHVKEVHYNQHGILMLAGQGMYMLNDRFLPVTAGDVIYMAPFVPQWYAALAPGPTRYMLYKDINLDPIIHA